MQDRDAIASLNAVDQAGRDEVLKWEYAQGQYKPSTVYRWPDLVKGVEDMSEFGVNGEKFWLGNEGESQVYGLVSIAAFLAQAMKETIKYNVCDENNWDSEGGNYAASNACGQLGQSYQDYKCSADQEKYQCEVDPEMAIRASTSATWYGAPGPLFCGPKSLIAETPRWDYSSPWCDPNVDRNYEMTVEEYITYLETGGECRDYPGQKAGGMVDCPGGCANAAGRTDVEGCCWWGRGVIQTTGICNFGKFNWFMGKKAFDREGSALFPTVDFCKNPEAICTSEEHPELKWIAGLFFWIQEVQTWNTAEFNYLERLRQFVDGGMVDSSFIDAVSGIVNRGCPNAVCAAGAVDGLSDRRQNFKKVLEAMNLP